MTEKITVYEKPTCSKCRETDRVLREREVEYEKINYYVQPIGKAKLRELLGKMGIAPRALLRSSEKIYKELQLGKADYLSDDEIIDLMVKHPDLIQRPILEKGKKAVLGRPIENIYKLL